MRNALEIVDFLGLPKVSGVMQVGANTGQELDYFVSHGVFHGILIEALEEPFSYLCNRCADLQEFIPVHALCSSRDGDMVEMHVASNFGESSSILPPTGHLTDYPFVQFPGKRVIQTLTLDRIMLAINNSRPEISKNINLLFMDVQGAELHVLKGASAVLQQVDYVYTEVGLGGGYQNDVPLEDLISYLKLFDFRLAEVEMNREGWGNAMFIRCTGRKWGRASV